MTRAPRFQLIITPSGVTPMIASRDTSTMLCSVESSSLTPVSCSSVPFQPIQTAALAITWTTKSMMKSGVAKEPRRLGAKMQKPSKLGMTKLGRGHNLRLMRKIEELLVGSIFRGGLLGLSFQNLQGDPRAGT